jgi:hypothetical protein
VFGFYSSGKFIAQREWRGFSVSYDPEKVGVSFERLSPLGGGGVVQCSIFKIKNQFLAGKSKKRHFERARRR